MGGASKIILGSMKGIMYILCLYYVHKASMNHEYQLSARG